MNIKLQHLKQKYEIGGNALQVFCQQHPKKVRAKDPYCNTLKQTFFNGNKLLFSQHNCKPYFFTLIFPFNEDLESQWKQCINFIETFKQEIHKSFLVVGGVISVEAHKNSTLKKKTGKNTKAGRPHLHMLLWFCHDFLNHDIEKLKQVFLKNKLGCKVKNIKTDLEQLKAFLYIIKEKGDTNLRAVCQQFTKWEFTINVWSNHDECSSLFKDVFHEIGEDNAFFTDNSFNRVPTTKFNEDTTLLLAELFSKMFRIQGLAVRDEQVYRRIEGTQFSWEVFTTIDKWIAQRFSFDFPPDYLAKLRESANWIIQEGRISKNSVRINLFPKIILQFYMIEFKDKVYDFFRAQLYEKEQLPKETATVCYVNSNFDDLKLPYNTVGLLYTIINQGKEDLHLRCTILEKEKISTQQLNQLQVWKKNDATFKECFAAIGGLFHPELGRKQNKALYFYGDPSSYKTFLLKTLFQKLVGMHHVDILSRTTNRFNVSMLKKDDEQPFICLFDDLRWDTLGLHKADFLNLLDGNFVSTEEKFKKRTVQQLQGTIAITTNQELSYTNLGLADTPAFKTRLTQIQTHALNIPGYSVPDFLYHSVENEIISFAILANAYFLSQNKFIKEKFHIHTPKEFNQHYLLYPEDNRIAWCGSFHVRKIRDSIT